MRGNVMYKKMAVAGLRWYGFKDTMMKQILPVLAAVFLAIALACCSKTSAQGTREQAAGSSAVPGKSDGGINTAHSGQPAVAPRDWREIYLEELFAAQGYSAAANWENYTLDSKYPIKLYAAQLIDLNFDGIPELLFFGPGAGWSQEMRILTIDGSTGGVRMIFNGWGNMGQFTLYRKLGTEDNFFAFESANGDMINREGAFYLTGADTGMDAGFQQAAKYAEFCEHSDFDDELNYLGSSYTFNKKDVSEYDYTLLMDNLFAGYDQLPYRPNGMIWDSEGYGDSFSLKQLTQNELISFLASYDPWYDDIGEMGDLWYTAEDFYSDELIRYVLDNIESAAELVYENGMSVLVTGETVELDGRICRIVILGTDHEDYFVREIFYAVYALEDIYRYDPVEDEWYLIFVYGAVG